MCRDDPAGRDEQYERFYLLLLDASGSGPRVQTFAVGEPARELSLGEVLDDLLRLVAERNPDFYEYADGRLSRATG